MTRYDETVCLAVLDGPESVFVAIEETTQPVRLQTWVGRRSPAFASASGRVCLAAWPAELGRDRVRRDGFAENHEDTAAGLYTASVPVVNENGTVLAAVTVCVPTSRIDAARRQSLLGELIAAGRGLSHDVAWLPAFHAKRQ